MGGNWTGRLRLQRPDIDATSTATFTINKKAAKITLTGTSKTYGENDPVLTVTKVDQVQVELKDLIL